MAYFRREGSAAEEHLTVRYPGRSCDVELACGGNVLWSGAWSWEVCRDGRPLAPVSDWRPTCWVSDADVDYLELEIELAGSMRVQRHIAMARKDRFLLLADALLGDQPGKLDYRATWALGPAARFHGAAATREGSLGAARVRARVLPLALPEWRDDRRVGELTATPQALELRQSVDGRRMLAPLFLDFAPNRLRQRLTWRSLTVGRSLAAEPLDVATAYRVAIANRQWLIYRSLAPRANRTVLGHNLSTETLIARFDRKGEVESIIEIEGS